MSQSRFRLLSFFIALLTTLTMEAAALASDRPIHLAVALGDTEWVKALIEAGADVNAKGDHGFTPLHYAAYNGDLVITGLLLRRGADFNARDNQGRSPLDYARARQHKELVDLYLGKNTSYRIEGPIWEKREVSSPLHAIAREPNAVVKARLLIGQGADVNLPDGEGCTPLHRASEAGREDMTTLLVNAGASVEAKDHYSRTPLFYAVSGGHEPAARALLRLGGNPRAKNNAGETPLHCASSLEAALILLQAGADAKCRDGRGATPLSAAATRSDVGLVELLISKGTDVNAADNHGWTPLHNAAVLGHKEVVEVLLRHGARPSVRDDQARSPEDLARMKNQVHILPLFTGAPPPPADTAALIREAVDAGDLAAIETLLREDPSAVNVSAKDGNTPLHLAASKGAHLAIASFLLLGASPACRDNQGQTPLHLATTRQAVEVLISRGADVNARDRCGQTPLHTAALSGRYDVLSGLLAHGAEPELKDNLGKTPFEAALMTRDRRAMEILSGHAADTGSAPDPVALADDLFAAVARNDVPTMKGALMKGADINARGPGGETPLDLANRMGLTQMGEVIRAAGGKRAVDLDSGPEGTGSSAALLEAAKSGDLAAVRAQLDKGTPVNVADEQGLTPLHLAATYGHRSVTAELIEAGADVNATTHAGATPLHKAIQRDHRDVAELLLAKGASVKAADGEGRTPLDLARQQGDGAMVKLLKRARGQ